MSFLAELKRRRVVRVAIVYGAVAFTVLQAADLVVPRLQLPDWTVTLMVVLALLGFPIALVLAWAFELTPDGVRRTEPVAALPPPTERPAWIGARTVIAAVVFDRRLLATQSDRSSPLAMPVVETGDSGESPTLAVFELPLAGTRGRDRERPAPGLLPAPHFVRKSEDT